MAKPSLAERMQQQVVKVVNVTNEKIGVNYLEMADVELRALFGVLPMEWEAKVNVGHFMIGEIDNDPIQALKKLEDSILNTDFSRFPQR